MKHKGKQCKFCRSKLVGRRCESSSGEGPDGEYEVHYCGNEECPVCHFCQGVKSTPENIRTAMEIAKIKRSASHSSGHRHRRR